MEVKQHLNSKLAFGNGLTPKIRKAIDCGISKINVNTDFQIAWHKGVVEFVTNNPNVFDPRKVISAGEKLMKEVVREKVHLFMNDKQI